MGLNIDEELGSRPDKDIVLMSSTVTSTLTYIQREAHEPIADSFIILHFYQAKAKSAPATPASTAKSAPAPSPCSSAAAAPLVQASC